MNDATLTRTTDSDPCDSNRDRGQTVQDFAVGIGIFLLAVAFVFSFVPTIITPFADAGGASTAQADRIAATIVENASTGNQTNEINGTIIGSGHYNGTSEDLAEPLGLRNSGGHAIDNVNITVIQITEVAKPEPSFNYSSGDSYDDQVGSSATRIVTTAQSDTCNPACQLVVRVW